MSRSIEKEWAIRWDQALDRRGTASVVATLVSGVGVGRASPFPPGIHGIQDPTRGFVEDWIVRKEAANRKLETMRFHYIFCPALLAALAAVWFVVRDLMK